MDCFGNQVKTPEDRLESINWENINPATGPVFVENAEPGDVLKVTVEKIELPDQGVMAAGKGFGVTGRLLEGLEYKLVKFSGNKIIINDQISIEANPMIGVIGVAPEENGINCGTPGSHGGNMDNNMITEGAVLYLPVFVEGALFALGDVHAAMGDGEVCFTGVEAPATVRVRLEVKKGCSIKNPVLENKDYLSTIASAESIDEAIETATIDMALILKDRLPYNLYEISMLMSVAGQAQICQVVDPLKTARFLIPKKLFNVAANGFC